MSFSNKEKRKVVVLENGLISTYTVRDGLMKELLTQDFDVYVLTHTNQFKEEVEKAGLKVIDVGSGNTSPFKIFSYIRKIYRHMRVIQPDICLTFSVRPAIWGNLVARILHIPVITNISGIGPLFNSQSFAYRFIRLIYPFALGKTRKVFFQNEEDREIFISRNLVSREKTGRIAGSGIDYEKFSPVTNQKSNNQHFSFLFIGRLIKDKGILEFIEAAKALKQKHPDILFKVIGPLWRQNLKSNSLTEIQINEWISEGIISYEGEKKDVRSDIALADCVVLPSYREGISNVLLESSSMEKPCIASNVTGCKEIIEHENTGLLCNVQDAADLARKMEVMYYKSPLEREEMGKRARQKVIREFDKKTVITSYIFEINNILEIQSSKLAYHINYSPAKEKTFAQTAGALTH